MKNKKGFTLVELMVVVAIVAILAAVALPMYSTFKQKGKVSTAIKALSGAQAALQTYFDDNANFTGINMLSTGGALKDVNGSRIGAGVPEIENMVWTLTTPDTRTVNIQFDFTNPAAGCPDEVCDGNWTMVCSSTNDKCIVYAVIGIGDPLGLNFGDTSASPD